MNYKTSSAFTTTVPVEPSHLEYLGKQAATLAETSGLNLTDAVVTTLGSEKLAGEHVRRVVEFANIEAFQKKFSSLHGNMRVVDIEGGPADPERVLHTLSNNAQPEQVVLQSIDYDLPPETKVASVTDFGLDRPFRTKEGAFNDLGALRSKLASAQEEAAMSAGSAKYQMTTALQDLIGTVKTATLDGLHREDIAAAWHRVDPEVMGTAMRYMPSLPSRGGVKVAHRVNPHHPVVCKYAEFAKHAHRYAAFEGARKNLEQRLIQVDTFIKERAS